MFNWACILLFLFIGMGWLYGLIAFWRSGIFDPLVTLSDHNRLPPTHRDEKPFLYWSRMAIRTLAVIFLFGTSIAAARSGGKDTFHSRGITYIVPLGDMKERGENPYQFTYYGKTVTMSERDGQLTVNGVPYGEVKTGDTVSVLKKGTVLVNDIPREPNKVGAANGSQPIRSQTNTTSSAAGSRR